MDYQTDFTWSRFNNHRCTVSGKWSNIDIFQYWVIAKYFNIQVDGMEQWIVRRAVVPFVVQLLGSSPLQNIRSPKNHVYDWLIDWRRLSEMAGLNWEADIIIKNDTLLSYREIFQYWVIEKYFYNIPELVMLYRISTLRIILIHSYML